MKRIYVAIVLSCALCACSGEGRDDIREVQQQMQYSKTHTGYANAAALQYALDHGISPDSAVVVLGSGKQ